MKMKKLVVTMFAAGVLASPLANATDGYFSDGYGMKSKGMGGVGIALPQDALAAANNPAGMVMVGDRADVGVDLFVPMRSTTITPDNTIGLGGSYGGSDRSLFLIPEFGYNKMIASDKSVGVSVYGNGGMNTSYTTSPIGANAGINLQQLFIAPTYAMKINDSNAIGISLNLVYQTFSATGLQNFGNFGYSSNAQALTNNGTDSSTGVGARIGWTGQVSPSVTLGATYQPKTKMSKFNKYAGLFAGQGSFDIPGSYGVGIAVKATDATTVSVDYKVIQYSGVPAIANTATQGGLLGANNGMGFGWTDVKVVKLGVSQAINDTFTVRAGYSHNTQPIPATQTFFNMLAPGVVQDHLTLGATWNVSKTNELTVGYMHAFQKTVNGVNSIAPGNPPGGLGGGNANITMYQDSLGVAYSWKL
jgi:long-chain fatty acid transport protein